MKSRIAVIGACGKMGSGIAELMMHHLSFEHKNYSLALVDTNKQSLLDSKALFRKNLRSFAEKNINRLRLYYQENPLLISNEEIIDAFLQELFDHVTFSTELEIARDAEWVFEAVFESLDLKLLIFNALKAIVSKETLIFSNTSAIPIKDLGDRVIGFHFYNPPTHNRMLEIVATERYKPLAESLAKELKKNYVFAGDVPGFIGNGHFIRELRFALDLGLPAEQIDTLFEKDLLRPFGPFRLATFIGIPTVIAIGEIMEIDCSPIKQVKIESLKPHKANPQEKPHLENPLSLHLLQNSKKIAEHLVHIGAAPDLKSVETVLKVGFQHPYGFEYV